ncbi:hypothetical protein [Halomonas nitroreducens]|uniref:Uncharacterized protein n=1 Tax=Halomonas nitroreducens TaxID=447425 RepID=A0A431UXY5_9GAMM|nr:hypothetical protein [Halomonas nitroreducens]RTQ97194.1 hypothetical protein EKG36_20280 [Halomonas nitroreducens]
MSFDIRFENERTTDGCIFVDFHFDAPSYQEPIDLAGEARQMSVSGNDHGFIYGSDLLGWDVVLGTRITPDQLEGIDIPGITFRTRESGGVSAFDFATQAAARAFITHVYEAFYEAFYLGFDTYTLDEAPAADTAPSARPAPVSPRSVPAFPAPLARDVATPALPRSPGKATERAAFYGTAVYPHLHQGTRYAWPAAQCLADRPGVDVAPFHPRQGSAPPAANRHESSIREGRCPTTAGRQCLTIHHPRNTP